MERYSDFQPTGFDPCGLGLEDQQDWFVLGVARTRDSGPRAESNFECALTALGGEGDDVEVHRFGHWGPGWFEIILIRPDSPAEGIGEEIEGALADYPVLDDMDCSEREWEAAAECWGWMSVSERVDILSECRGVSVFAARRDELPSDDQGRILERCGAYDG